MSSEVLTRRRWVPYALSILLWSSIGVFFATQTYLGRGANAGNWDFALRLNLPRWYIWGALAPLIFLVDRALAGRTSTLAHRITVHLPVGLMFCTVHIVARKLVNPLLGLRGDWSTTGFVTQYHWNLLIYAFIVGAGIAFDLFNRARMQELRASQLEARLADARLSTLRSQLRPHFLFNTLNTISAYIDREPAVARRMTASLGDLLRRSLDQGEEQEIPLSQELAMVDDYIAIQRERFGGRVRYESVIAADVVGACVPSLILQPIVENAIEHGLAERSGAGTVRVEAERVDGRLVLRVHDDGAGLPDDWETVEHGIGLSNTRERLSFLYGDEADFDVRSSESGGVTVELTIPWREGQE